MSNLTQNQLGAASDIARNKTERRFLIHRQLAYTFHILYRLQISKEMFSFRFKSKVAIEKYFTWD